MYDDSMGTKWRAWNLQNNAINCITYIFTYFFILLYSELSFTPNYLVKW